MPLGYFNMENGRKVVLVAPVWLLLPRFYSSSVVLCAHLMEPKLQSARAATITQENGRPQHFYGRDTLGADTKLVFIHAVLQRQRLSTRDSQPHSPLTLRSKLQPLAWFSTP